MTIALYIGILLALACYWVLNRSRLGYELRVVGRNTLAAQTAGIRIGRVILSTMFISGAIGGFAGVSMILGVNRAFVDGFSPGYGFNGIAIASLAGSNPLAVIPSAAIFGALRTGAMVLNRTARVQPEFADLIQALVVLFVAMPTLFSFWGNRKLKRGA